LTKPEAFAIFMVSPIIAVQLIGGYFQAVLQSACY
jgi:nitrate reductase NapE component